MSDLFERRLVIGNDGTQEVKQPKPSAKKQPAKTKPVKITNTTAKTVKKKIQNVNSILDRTEGRQIRYDEKVECLSNLVQATDDLRRLITPDEDMGQKEESQVTTIWKKRGYYLEADELGIKMVLPPVMGKKVSDKNIQAKDAERKYARQDLTEFIREEKNRLGMNESFMYDQVLVFTHERQDTGLFDYDNLSTSAYINAVADCFLAADNAKNIDFMQRFIRGEENRTVIYLVPRKNFAKWVKTRY